MARPVRGRRSNRYNTDPKDGIIGRAVDTEHIENRMNSEKAVQPVVTNAIDDPAASSAERLLAIMWGK